MNNNKILELLKNYIHNGKKNCTKCGKLCVNNSSWKEYYESRKFKEKV